MAMAAISGWLHYPRPWSSSNSAPTWGTTTGLIDAVNEKVGVVFTVPATGTLEAFGWGTRTVTNGATLDVRAETVDNATGNPSGTLLGTNSNASQVVANADDDHWFETVLTTGPSVAVGDEAAFVVSNPGASAGTMQIAIFMDENSWHPYTLLNTGAWAKQTFQGPCLAVRVSGTWYAVPGVVCPFSANSTVGISTGSTPDVAGLRFRVPVPMRVVGLWWKHDVDGDCVGKLVSDDYNQGADTATLKVVTRSIRATNRAGSTPGLMEILFTSPADLSADTYYRLLLEPTTATTCPFYYFTSTTANQIAALPGGSDFHMTAAKDPTGNASWTNYDNGTDGYRKPLMGLLVGGFDDGAGGGGGGGTTGRQGLHAIGAGAV